MTTQQHRNFFLCRGVALGRTKSRSESSDNWSNLKRSYNRTDANQGYTSYLHPSRLSCFWSSFSVSSSDWSSSLSNLVVWLSSLVYWTVGRSNVAEAKIEAKRSEGIQTGDPRQAHVTRTLSRRIYYQTRENRLDTEASARFKKNEAGSI